MISKKRIINIQKIVIKLALVMTLRIPLSLLQYVTLIPTNSKSNSICQIPINSSAHIGNKDPELGPTCRAIVILILAALHTEGNTTAPSKAGHNQTPPPHSSARLERNHSRPDIPTERTLSSNGHRRLVGGLRNHVREIICFDEHAHDWSRRDWNADWDAVVGAVDWEGGGEGWARWQWRLV